MKIEDLRRLDAAAHVPPSELDHEDPALLASLRQTAASEVRSAVLAQFEGAPTAIQEAVGSIEVVPRPGGDLRRDVLDALTAEGVAGADLEDARGRLAKLNMPSDEGALLQPDVPVGANPVFADVVAQAHLVHVGEIAGLAAEPLASLLETNVRPEALDDKVLGGLVAENKLSDDEAARFGATVGIYRLLDDDAGLTEAVRAGGRVAAPRDLLLLSANDWRDALEAAKTEPPPGVDREGYGQFLAARTEAAFAGEAMMARALAQDVSALAPALDHLQPLLAEHGALFADKGSIEVPAELKGDFDEMHRFATRHAALGVPELLNDAGASVEDRLDRVGQRLDALRAFAEANREVQLLGVDFAPGSPELESLKWDGIREEDRASVLAAVKADQRAYALTRDPADADELLSAGFNSAAGIVSVGRRGFVESGCVPADVADAYFDVALAATATTTNAVAAILDAQGGMFGDLTVGNLDPSIGEFLRQMDGYADLFGSQDYCACEHCSSLLSPAAYFVDLMHFVEEHLLGEFVGHEDHVLNLRVRRPDLWTLPLTCENTETEIPQLVIVDEILENYVARRHGYAGDLSDRGEVWRRVYRDSLQVDVDSFAQPFLLPLARLESYLAHFGRSRGDLLDAVGTTGGRRTAARLQLGPKEWQLVTEPNDDQAFLQRVYGIQFSFHADSTVEPFDAQALAGAVRASRDDLAALVSAWFVSQAGAHPIEIRGEKSSAESVQNDLERVHGARADSLDRLHRFTRLWRAIGWSPGELDVALDGDMSSDSVAHLVAIRELAARFGGSVEQTVAVARMIPTRPAVKDKLALWDSLFNLPDFVRLDGALPKDATRFVHPAMRSDPASAAGDHMLPRLLAGLRISTDELHALILALATPLGVKPGSAVEAERGFALSVANLSMLYRHARIAEHLRVGVVDLFRLIALAPDVQNDHIATLDDLVALLHFVDWWKPAGLDLEQLSYAVGAAVADPTRFPAPGEVAERVLERVAADKALTFGETIFALLPGVTEADSRAIIGANASSIVTADIPRGGYRLADDFDPSTPLTIPVGISVDEAAARALLVARHPTEVVPTYLAAELGVDVAKAEALLALAGADLRSPELASALRGGSPPGPITGVVGAVQPLAVLLNDSRFDAAAVQYLRDHATLFSLAVPAHATVEAVRLVMAFRDLPGKLAYRQPVLTAHTPASGFAAADQSMLAEVLGVDTALAASLQTHVPLPPGAIDALARLVGCAALAVEIGFDGATFADADSDLYEHLDAAADGVLAGFRSKHPDEDEWERTFAPFDGRLLNVRRDALIDHLINSVHPEFERVADLSKHFLIDVEVDGCFMTSRVVAAISSVQLYVHRVLMNLEQSQDGMIHISPTLVPGEEWTWRDHYRVWEANRKVFLWVENYLFPDLRDDKTPLFEELEGELLQKDIQEQAVLDAYGKYLAGFQEIAGLKIAGSYQQVDASGENIASDVLHLFGVTNDDPPSYYYRAVQNARYGSTVDARGIIWDPWRKLEVPIPVRRVAPVVYASRLHLFWVEITTRPQHQVLDGNSVFVGYIHTLALKFSTLQLDGHWTPPQKVRLLGVPPFIESDGGVDDPLADPEELAKAVADILKTIAFFGAFASEVTADQAKLLTPRYGTDPHTKPRDGYSLRGLEWEQVFPEPRIPDNPALGISGAGFEMCANLDLFSQTLVDRTTLTTRPYWMPNEVLSLRPSGDICVGSLPSIGQGLKLDPYAYAALVADPAALDRILARESASITKNVLEALKAHTPIATASVLPTLAPINGSLPYCVLEVGGDAYLITRIVGEQGVVTVRRLGTTLAETIARQLFSGGIDALLSLDFERDPGGEAPPAVKFLTSALQPAWTDGEIDFHGSLGTYFREIFFHIPFLIANHLNGQGNFADAQRWYQYIFNPTASEIIPDDPSLTAAQNAARKRDRNWRYIEFRGLSFKTLREVLSSKGAIEAYKRDPFNPHAIARLRLSAYQKAVVMRYIDNLLDWADDLFTQYQMETVNEATMLYLTAAEILGDRPAPLGECGLETPRTYESIRPFLKPGIEFLVEAEHWTWITNTRTWLGKEVKREQYVLSSATAASATEAALDTVRLRKMGIRPETLAGMAGGEHEPRESSTATVATRDGALVRADWKALLSRNRERTFDSDRTVSDSTGIGLDDRVAAHCGWSLVSQVSPVFCVPANRDLLAYWDRVEDRLQKLRNGMDITGARRRLSLFSPEIDPMMLVRERAAGLSIEGVLDALSGELPPYRFTYLIEKAKAYATTVQGLGTALLGALERKDTEELNQLRTVHQQQLLALGTKMRRWELDTAQRTVDALTLRRTATDNRRAYYQGLLDTRLIATEQTERVARHTANLSRGGEARYWFTSALLSLFAQAGSPFAITFGGQQLKGNAGGVAAANQAAANLADAVASSAALEAGYTRRDQGWRQQANAAKDELVEIDKQLEVANLRIEMAQRAKDLHQKSLDQIKEIHDLYVERFTNVELYNWLATILQRLHREAYNSAYAMARMAERAFRYERDDDDAALLSGSYWESGRSGLLSAARLLGDLQELERRFLETNYRQLEIDQAFSLAQFQPAALVALRERGSCSFTILEWMFNIAYPGHYRRRIKAVRLSIPCVAGPYANVSAELTLDSSQVRKDPNPANAALLDVPPSRTTTIATSTAQNDAGVFELSFRDERYMPFEGAGAISTWTLTLPGAFRPFDYSTINDVVLRISYTALEDGELRKTVESEVAAAQGAILNTLSNSDTPMPRVLSLRHELSTAYTRLLHSAAGTSLSFTLGEQHLPFFLHGRKLTVQTAKLAVQPREGQAVGTFSVKVNGTKTPDFAADDDLGGLSAASLGSAFSAGLLRDHTIELIDAGLLKPDQPVPGDASAIDETKLLDLLLYVEFTVG